MLRIANCKCYDDGYFDDGNFDNGYTPKCVTCPYSYSSGSFPNCECNNGGYFDVTKLQCLRCPPNANGSYPNCDCYNDGYFDQEIMKCATCPPNTSGSFPDCKCNNGGYYFSYLPSYCKSRFAQPLNSSSHADFGDCQFGYYGYDDYDDDYCITCPSNTSGIFPNCTCDNGGYFKSGYYDRYYGETLECLTCPSYAGGSYPNCKCDNGGYFNSESSASHEKTLECLICPSNTSGNFPICKCDNGDYFVSTYSLCASCPPFTTGTYPYNCKCKHGGLYDPHTNSCHTCPPNAPSGKPPDCKCNDGYFYNSSYAECSICPPNSTQYGCPIPCPENSHGVHPNCQCDNHNNFYDTDEMLCKSYSVVFSPYDAIGIPPDCLCMRKNYGFNWINWSCGLTPPPPPAPPQVPILGTHPYLSQGPLKSRRKPRKPDETYENP